VGTSSARSNLFNSTISNNLFQVEKKDDSAGISVVTNNATNATAYLALCRSRGSSIGSNTLVTNGDVLGTITFQGNDGTEFVDGARIEAYVDSTSAANDLPTRLVFSTTADGASTPTERMRITNDGYLRLAGAGIQFNGDTAAANALDDYEEGTWTPSVEFGGATTGITYNGRQGYYVKTGKVVHVWLYFNMSSKGSATGTATVAGLPFTSEDFNVSGLTNWPGSKPSRRQNETSSDFAMSALENNSEVGITNAAGSLVTDSTFTNNTIIECALCYRAA
jgi:hypothetical protein